MADITVNPRREMAGIVVTSNPNVNLAGEEYSEAASCLRNATFLAAIAPSPTVPLYTEAQLAAAANDNERKTFIREDRARTMCVRMAAACTWMAGDANIDFAINEVYDPTTDPIINRSTWELLQPINHAKNLGPYQAKLRWYKEDVVKHSAVVRNHINAVKLYTSRLESQTDELRELGIETRFTEAILQGLKQAAAARRNISQLMSNPAWQEAAAAERRAQLRVYVDQANALPYIIKVIVGKASVLPPRTKAEFDSRIKTASRLSNPEVANQVTEALRQAIAGEQRNLISAWTTGYNNNTDVQLRSFRIFE